MTLADLDPVALLILWGVLAGIGRLAQGKEKGQGRPRPRSGPPARRDPATRRQPTTFEELLAEMQGRLEEAPEDAIGDRDGVTALPSAEEVEERESLEVIPVPVSLETPSREFGREAADDRMLETQRAIAERVREAEARNRGWRLSDHDRFDAEIRRTAPRPAAVRHSTRPPLRQAIVWREILGTPVGLREPGES